MKTTGIIENNTYKNEFFGIEYTLSESFNFYSADQLSEMNAAIANTNKDQAVVEAYEGGSAFFDMTATSESNPNDSIVIQIAGPDVQATDMDEAGYIEAASGKIIEQLKDAGATVKITETKTYKNSKTGDEFSAMKLDVELLGLPMCEEIICIKSGDCFMNITATVADEAVLDTGLGGLARIK